MSKNSILELLKLYLEISMYENLYLSKEKQTFREHNMMATKN